MGLVQGEYPTYNIMQPLSSWSGAKADSSVKAVYQNCALKLKLKSVHVTRICELIVKTSCVREKIYLLLLSAVLSSVYNNLVLLQ